MAWGKKKFPVSLQLSRRSFLKIFSFIGVAMDPEVNRPPSEDNRDNNPNEANETEQAMDQQDLDSDHDGKFANRCRSVPEIIEYWNHQLTNETLSSHHFREWWRVHVPKIFPPTPQMQYLFPLQHVDEADVNEMLLAPLERFLCDDPSPETVFKSLAEKNDPPSMCGKMFKAGEPTYSCRDCGHDPTCVLCVECFKNSEHQRHRYKISTSNGGGYCDCGDPEAWNQNVHCSIHEQGAAIGQMDTNELINRLPETVKIRARHVFAAVLDYIFDTLTMDLVLRLPPDLTYKVPEANQDLADFMESSDDYATVIYNDEFHRVDEVIDTLRTVLECERSPAIGLTTLIDRNGRCVVKCCGYATCQEIKKQAEKRSSRRGGKALKVQIMHSHVIAHQNFAEKLISWLHSMMEHSSSFRALLGSLLLEHPISGLGKICRLDNFLRNDIIMWKSARCSIHHFLIQAMLLGNDANRKAFATLFTKNFGQMMKEFITDDHEHSVSVTSLSVQLFTVPTLAHYLIAHQDVLATLLRTFMSECERKRNDRGKLEFQRNLQNQSFQRACFILHDIKYLLNTAPDDQVCKTGWTNELRKGFLHGLSNLMDILSWMQGMDLQVRQVSHHIDHEFEWEPYFGLYIKFMQIIPFMVKWCSTDKIVYIKAIRMLFKKLFEDQNSTGQEECTQNIGEKATTCIEYQVSSKPVALHHPLTRLLAALSLHMDKFEFDFDSNELDIMERPRPIQMMEPSLRTTVFVAQIQAGLWRRNGHSLLDQIHAYHDPRFRKEMVDRDIIMLQLAAANMPSDDFLINVVSKFQLIPWSSEEFDLKEDDSIRQMNQIAEELLSTLIYIVGERYIPRVGEVTHEDCVKNEIVQLLCITDMAHSQLTKYLAEDGSSLEKVVDSVANFKRGQSTAKVGNGRYELKPEFYSQYNVFHYRYSREAQSKSEEKQRHRRKDAGEPECTPPPKPPKFTKQFLPLLKIMESDVFINLIKLILDRADNLRSRCFSEAQVHKALHLIGICLLEEDRQDQEPKIKFTEAAAKQDIFGKLQKLVDSQRIESHKDLLAWTISTWGRVAGIIQEPTSMDTNQSQMRAMKEPSPAADEKEIERKRLAAERRKKVMEQMKNAQKNFMKENKDLFVGDSAQKRPRLNTESKDDEMVTVEPSVPTVIQCLGPDRASPTVDGADSEAISCILCQEEEVLNVAEGQALVTCAFLQRSTVLSNRMPRAVESLYSSRPELQPNVPLLTSDLHFGIHTSSCGHVMHARCWEKYFEDVHNSERTRSRLRSPQNFDALKGEFLCPMCRSLQNMVIPLVPKLHTLQTTIFSANDKAANNENKMETDQEQDMLQDMEEESASASGMVLSKGNEVDVTQPIRLSFKNWLDALFIAQKYKKELKADSDEQSSETTNEDGSTPTSKSLPSELGLEFDFQRLLNTASERASRIARGLSTSSTGSGSAKTGSSGPEAGPSTSSKPMMKPSMKRFYTCPLDQVVQEMDQNNSDKSVSLAFSRLFSDHENQEVVFTDKFFDILKLFCNSVLRITNKVTAQQLADEDTEKFVINERGLFEVWNTCAFTIHSAVHAELDVGRGASLVTTNGMSKQNQDCLAALVRLCAVMSSSNLSQPNIVRSHGLRLLSLLTEIDGMDNPSILEIDAFGLLVALTFCAPSLFNGDQAAQLPLGTVQDQHLLRLVYMVHLVQIMITTDQFSQSVEEENNSSKKETGDFSIVLQMLHEVRDAVGFASDDDGSEGLSGNAVWHDLKNASIPFLRAAAVFYHHLTGVQGPPSLQHFHPNEHTELCKYLGLPLDPTELFSEIANRDLARLWAQHPSVQASVQASSMRTLSFPLKLNSLVRLPEDYSELVNNVSTFSCPNVGVSDGCRVPAMCLICGKVICSQSYCCQEHIEGRKDPVGACTAHVRVCGGGVGIFLRIRECRIVLLAQGPRIEDEEGRSKGCFQDSPYVDQYGETDDQLKRGNPLKLCPDKYRKIYKWWLKHSIPNTISHTLEARPYDGQMNTPWDHL